MHGSRYVSRSVGRGCTSHMITHGSKGQGAIRMRYGVPYRQLSCDGNRGILVLVLPVVTWSWCVEVLACCRADRSPLPPVGWPAVPGRPVTREGEGAG